MDNKQNAVVQGTLDMLILKTLALEPMHGYGIGVRIRTNQQRRFPGQCRLTVPSISTSGTGRTD